MENDNGQSFAKTAKATYSPDDVDIVGEEDIDDNGVASGSRKDQLDMRRMGKSQELKVC